MTTEEKAKAYDEALEKAKEMMDNCSFETTKVVCQELFPELVESEDERIRKEMIDFIQWSEDRGMTRHDYHQAKRPAVWIAYLEKQKEDKWSPSEDEMGVLYKLCYISSRVTDEDDTNLTRLYQDLKREYFNGHSFENMFPSEKQKEQKSYEPKNWPADKDSLTQEQKPAQTSEEKEYIRTLKSLISDFIRDKQPEDVVYYQRVYDWLDGRHIEQKPVEWSEVDEKMLKGIIEKAQAQVQWCDGLRPEQVSWLKSLRPSWKPSEEEERLINTSISFLKDFADKGI